MDEFLTEREAAGILGCSKWKVHDLRISGKLSYLPSRPVAISRRSVDRYLENERHRKESEARYEAGLSSLPRPIPPVEVEAVGNALLLQIEVAKYLRCSLRHVRRLRKEGMLPYLPSRPIKIVQRDLAEYVESALVRTSTGQRAQLPPGVTAVQASARLWALTAILLRRDYPRNPPKPEK
jgi:hypothetical protein